MTLFYKHFRLCGVQIGGFRHGRSKEARYTKLADWSYIDRCAQIAAPLPFCGNGDILSYEDAVAHKTRTKVGRRFKLGLLFGHTPLGP